MVDRLKEIPGKILEWWNKFTTKQKALLVSSVSAVVIALGILTFVLTRPTMVTIMECENTKEAGQVKTLFEDNNIAYDVSDDGLVFKVNKKKEADAAILLGENNITASVYDLNSVFEGGFSLTEADKTKKYQLYMESKLAEQLKTVEAVQSAIVSLSIPSNDGTILAQEKESFASIMLNLSGELEEESALGIAKFVAAAIGNDTTDNVLILDSSSNVLYSGGDSSTGAGTVNSNLDVKEKAESQMKSQVKEIMLGTGVYDNVSIGVKLDMGFEEKEVTEKTYTPYDPDSDRGLVNSESQYESESEGGAAAAPGTDANDDTTYTMEEDAYSSNATTDRSTQYDNNEKIEHSKSSGGDVSYDTSSITVVANQYRIYNEETLTKDGTLNGTTFEAFKTDNEAQVKLDVDQEFITMVSNATGIPEANITVVAYEVPFFQYDETSGRSLMDYLPIILAALIMLMLGFVVFRSTRKEPEPEMEGELSVEALLESTKEAQEEELEDIGFSEKSETRILIENFVDENPEAAASLLRNWLNEEWE